MLESQFSWVSIDIIPKSSYYLKTICVILKQSKRHEWGSKIEIESRVFLGFFTFIFVIKFSPTCHSSFSLSWLCCLELNSYYLCGTNQSLNIFLSSVFLLLYRRKYLDRLERIFHSAQVSSISWNQLIDYNGKKSSKANRTNLHN